MASSTQLLVDRQVLASLIQHYVFLEQKQQSYAHYGHSGRDLTPGTPLPESSGTPTPESSHSLGCCSPCSESLPSDDQRFSGVRSFDMSDQSVGNPVSPQEDSLHDSSPPSDSWSGLFQSESHKTRPCPRCGWVEVRSRREHDQSYSRGEEGGRRLEDFERTQCLPWEIRRRTGKKTWWENHPRESVMTTSAEGAMPFEEEVARFKGVEHFYESSQRQGEHFPEERDRWTWEARSARQESRHFLREDVDATSTYEVRGSRRREDKQMIHKFRDGREGLSNANGVGRSFDSRVGNSTPAWAESVYAMFDSDRTAEASRDYSTDGNHVSPTRSAILQHETFSRYSSRKRWADLRRPFGGHEPEHSGLNRWASPVNRPYHGKQHSSDLGAGSRGMQQFPHRSTISKSGECLYESLSEPDSLDLEILGRRDEDEVYGGGSVALHINGDSSYQPRKDEEEIHCTNYNGVTLFGLGDSLQGLSHMSGEQTILPDNASLASPGSASKPVGVYPMSVVGSVTGSVPSVGKITHSMSSPVERTVSYVECSPCLPVSEQSHAQSTCTLFTPTSTSVVAMEEGYSTKSDFPPNEHDRLCHGEEFCEFSRLTDSAWRERKQRELLAWDTGTEAGLDDLAVVDMDLDSDSSCVHSPSQCVDDLAGESSCCGDVNVDQEWWQAAQHPKTCADNTTSLRMDYGERLSHSEVEAEPRQLPSPAEPLTELKATSLVAVDTDTAPIEDDLSCTMPDKTADLYLNDRVSDHDFEACDPECSEEEPSRALLSATRTTDANSACCATLRSVRCVGEIEHPLLCAYSDSEDSENSDAMPSSDFFGLSNIGSENTSSTETKNSEDEVGKVGSTPVIDSKTSCLLVIYPLAAVEANCNESAQASNERDNTGVHNLHLVGNRGKNHTGNFAMDPSTLPGERNHLTDRASLQSPILQTMSNSTAITTEPPLSSTGQRLGYCNQLTGYPNGLWRYSQEPPKQGEHSAAKDPVRNMKGTRQHLPRKTVTGLNSDTRCDSNQLILDQEGQNSDSAMRASLSVTAVPLCDGSSMLPCKLTDGNDVAHRTDPLDATVAEGKSTGVSSRSQADLASASGDHAAEDPRPAASPLVPAGNVDDNLRTSDADSSFLTTGPCSRKKNLSRTTNRRCRDVGPFSNFHQPDSTLKVAINGSKGIDRALSQLLPTDQQRLPLQVPEIQPSSPTADEKAPVGVDVSVGNQQNRTSRPSLQQSIWDLIPLLANRGLPRGDTNSFIRSLNIANMLPSTEGNRNRTGKRRKTAPKGWARQPKKKYIEDANRQSDHSHTLPSISRAGAVGQHLGSTSRGGVVGHCLNSTSRGALSKHLGSTSQAGAASQHLGRTSVMAMGLHWHQVDLGHPGERDPSAVVHIRSHRRRMSVSNPDEPFEAFRSEQKLLEEADKIVQNRNFSQLPKIIRPSMHSLVHACKRGELMKALVLLDIHGLDPNTSSKDGKGNTPVHVAAESGDILLIMALQKYGGDVNKRNSLGATPLICSASSRLGDKLRSVIEYFRYCHVDFNAQDNEGLTALHYACAHDNFAAADTLAHGTDLNLDLQDNGGWTALMWAMEKKMTGLAPMLVRRGADVNVLDKEGNSALHWAAYSGIASTVSLLIDHGANINQQTQLGDTPLHIAVRRNHVDCVVKLLETGLCDLSVVNKEDETAEEVAPLDGQLTNLLCMFKTAFSDQPVNRNRFANTIVCTDISLGKEPRCIPAINEIDGQLPPQDYHYITTPVQTCHIPPKTGQRALHVCWCPDNGVKSCTNGRNKCKCLSRNPLSQCWYDQNGLLDVSIFNSFSQCVLHECTPLCHCHKDCPNRLVQRGSWQLLELFKTAKMGWGVRAASPIKKGSFVCEYVGEHIPEKEANSRAQDSYIFDLCSADSPSKGKVELWSVDARQYGNVSRFINHSCDPNLMPLRVLYDHQDARFPHMAFFAICDIPAGAQLSFDYGESFWKVKKIACQCNTPECRYKETK